MSRILLEAGARWISGLHMIHTGYLNDQPVDCGHLKANQIHHGTGCTPVVAKEIVTIYGC